MAQDYLKTHPSQQASFSELGMHLPGFLRGWSGECACADLAGLAALEWARAKVLEERNVQSAPPVRGALAERADAVEAAFQAISSWFAEGWICAEGAP